MKNNLEARFIELRNENSKYSIKVLELEQELQKTREQLEKAEKVLKIDADINASGWDTYRLARQYFKDKQGE